MTDHARRTAFAFAMPSLTTLALFVARSSGLTEMPWAWVLAPSTCVGLILGAASILALAAEFGWETNR